MMNNYLKQNWKGITATVVAFGAVLGAIYYVNVIYLPGQRQAARAAEPTATEPIAKKEYHYTVDVGNAQAANANTGAAGSSTNPANDRIKVTTDKDGNVTIDRTWDAAPGELDASTAAPSGPTANIGSGGGKITGEDGAYHGEKPTTPPPSTGSSGATTTKPSTDTSTGTENKPSTGGDSSKPGTGTENQPSGGGGSKPNDGTENKPTTPPADKPTTPSGGGSTTEKPSGGSNNGSSTPENGDTRTENGQNQIYIDGFGWVMDASGGESDYIEMPEGDFGGADGLGAQVGEMG